MSLASVVRPREVARAVTPLELLFDLVYVFTVSQLSSNLMFKSTGAASPRPWSSRLPLCTPGS
jgi:low temperature requirement protein LtrA